MSWSSFDKFNDVIDQYLPSSGQGNTFATQIVTAINKIVYTWFNNGRVYGQTYETVRGYMFDIDGYAASCANWLYDHSSSRTKDLLEEVYYVKSEDDYERILYNLCSTFLDPNLLEKKDKKPATGDIGSCHFHLPDYPFGPEEDYF